MKRFLNFRRFFLDALADFLRNQIDEDLRRYAMTTVHHKKHNPPKVGSKQGHIPDPDSSNPGAGSSHRKPSKKTSLASGKASPARPE
jgi:hypothetical protein